MNNEEIFGIWAPEHSVWSRWAKPVLFARMNATPPTGIAPATTLDANWAPGPGEGVALVLDVPGALGAQLGVLLAARGYRPVPLYNAVPLPAGELSVDPATGKPVAAVDVLPIIDALKMGALELAGRQLPPNAPPAFLLAADRAAEGRRMAADEFDNRSVSFTTDFPSANFLASQGIQRVLLAQQDRLDPRSDLAHSLRRWQDGGLKLERLRLVPPSAREPFEIPRPLWYGAMFQRALARLGLARAGGGGFGAWMPGESAGGG